MTTKSKLPLRLRWGLPISIVVGLGMLYLSFVLNDVEDADWWSEALTNVGSSVLLFAPLLLVSEWLLDRRVARLEGEVKQTQSEVGDAQSQLAEVRDYLDPSQRNDAAVDLDIQVRERLDAERQEEEDLFASLAVARVPEPFIAALDAATKAGLISKSGPRVELLYSDLHLRFRLDVAGELLLIVENGDGSVCGTVTWKSGVDIAEPLVAVGEIARKQYGFDGMDKFFPGQVPRQLSDMLTFVSKHRMDWTGDRAISDVIEITESGWIITERALLPQSIPYYEIAVKRLGELDWEEHILRKGWPESASFPHTFGWAKKLLAKKTSS